MKRLTIFMSFIFLASMLVMSLPERSEGGWGDKIKQTVNKSKGRIKSTYNKTKEKTGNTYNRTKETYKRKARNTYNQGKQKTQYYYQKKKQNFGNQGKSIVNKTTRVIRNAGRRYGNATAQQLENMRNRGSQEFRDAKRILDRKGREALKSVGETYNRYGNEVGRKFKNFTMKNTSASASRIKRAIDAMNDNHQRNYLLHMANRDPVLTEKIGMYVIMYSPRVARLAVNTAIHVSGKAGYYVKTKEGRRKAVEAAVVTAVMYQKFDRDVKEMTTVAVRGACRNVHIDTPYGRVSLESYTKTYIKEKCPYLEGTSIAEDPAKAFTYIVIFNDPSYVTKEMRIIENPDTGHLVSMDEMLEYSAPQEYAQTMKVLETVEAIETLGDGEASPEDIMAAALVLEKANAI